MSDLLPDASEELRHLTDAHPWLARRIAEKNYLSPEYYRELLHPYSFNGREDLDYLRDFLERAVRDRENLNVLELGGGDGRSTDIALAFQEIVELDVVDLSSEMIEFSSSKYRNDSRVRFCQADSVAHLRSVSAEYDVVFSAWSLSHSIHQTLVTHGIVVGRELVRSGLRRLVLDLLRPAGRLFIVHFDALSDEQQILIPQWCRAVAIVEPQKQSPSKMIIDQVMSELQDQGLIRWKSTHLPGDPIRYRSLEVALEVFLNFGLECHFNDRPELPVVLREVTAALRSHTQPDGSVLVRPGCYLQEAVRVDRSRTQVLRG